MLFTNIFHTFCFKKIDIKYFNFSVPSNYEFLVVPNYQYLTRLWLYIALINGGITVENHAK